jgi:hypothetical protein
MKICEFMAFQRTPMTVRAQQPPVHGARTPDPLLLRPSLRIADGMALSPILNRLISSVVRTLR